MDWDTSGGMGAGCESRSGYGTGGGGGLGQYDQAAYVMDAYGSGLEGIFSVLAAPFKLGARAVGGVVKTAVRVAPAAAIGFLTAGPAGAVAGIGTRLIRGSGGNVAQATQQALTTQGTWNPTQATGGWNPAHAAVAPPPGGTSISDVLAMLKDELLATGGRMVAETPQGAAAIREQVSGDIGRYMLPVALGVGGLLLVTMLRR